MAEFSLNGDFEELVKQTLEQNQLTEPVTENKMEESAKKSDISFKKITPSKKTTANHAQKLEQNQEIFFPTFPTSVKLNKIFTTKTSSLMFAPC